MKRYLYLLALFPSIAFSAPEQQVDLPIPKGMVSAYDSINLSPEFVKDAQNVYFDADLGSSKRGGYEKVNSVSLGSKTVTEMYGYSISTGAIGSVHFSSNSTEILTFFSGSTMAYTLGGTTFTVIISTLNESYPIDCVPAFGRLWCVNGDRSFSYLAGTHTMETTGFPTGTMIEFHANRLWVAGVPGNESTLYGSKFLDGTNWTLGGNAGDAVQIPIGLNDGDVITCVRSYGDALVTGKRRTLWALIGASQLDFGTKNLSRSIGCFDDHTMREKQGSLFWLSQRGLEKFSDGLVDPPFGAPIKDWTDKFLSGPPPGGGAASFTDSTQADFEAGISTYLNSSTLPGSVFISSPIVDVSTVILDANSVAPYAFASNVYGGGIPKGAFAMSFVAQMDTRLLEAHFEARPDFIYTSESGHVIILTTGDVTPSAVTLPVSTGNVLPLLGFPVTVYGKFPSATNSLTQGVTYWIVSYGTGSVSGGTGLVYVNITTDAAKTQDFTLAISTDNRKDSAWTLYPTTVPFVNVVLSSAIIFSSIRDLGSTVRSIDFFSGSEILNEGDIDYYARTASSFDGISGAGWTAQPLGGSFTAGKNRFVQWRADFSRTVSSQNPILQDITVTWTDTDSKPHLASWIVDGRYLLSGSTASVADTSNETIIVVDKFDNFTRINGMNAMSFADAFGKTYFGTSMSSGPKSGLLYRMTDSFSDDTNPIDAFVRIRDDCFGNCAQDKYFSKIYVKTKGDGSAGGMFSSAITFDRNGTESSLMDVTLDGSGLAFPKIPIPLGDYGVRGKSASFLFRNSQLGHGFKYYGGSVHFRPAPVE